VNVTNPSYFIFTFVKKKEIATIILTLQMVQAMSFMKSKVEIVFDVSHFNFAPHMAIMFPIHFLQLLIVTIMTNKGGIQTKHHH
jgi:hypothetical protein